MNDVEILNQITQVFRLVFDDKNIIVTRDTTANDIEAWDSLNHLHLIVSLEKHFKIKFKTVEAQEFKNVGEIGDAINNKINKK